ncbi:MAG: AraC family transcriptional regulator [Dehalococcoidales bacterium]
MFEWNRSIQKMLDVVEENLTGPLTLEMLAGKLGYSPYYCTRQFHRYAGISLRDYIRLRKVSSAVIDLRDTGDRIIDIAVKYGFSSQEAFTRSFKRACGMTPNEYRRLPRPLPLLVKRNVFNPYLLGLMETKVKENATNNITVSVQVIPAHKFIGIRHLDVPGYWEFWQKEEEIHGKDRCDEVDGVLSSIKSFNGCVGGRFYQEGKPGYMYGIEVPAKYAGEIPEGMECLCYAEGPYAVFHHPPYDYTAMERSVDEAMEKFIGSWDPGAHGYAWDRTRPTYYRHNPAGYGQAAVIPLKKTK